MNLMGIIIFTICYSDATVTILVYLWVARLSKAFMGHGVKICQPTENQES
jgi:hypothetical protein